DEERSRLRAANRDPGVERSRDRVAELHGIGDGRIESFSTQELLARLVVRELERRDVAWRETELRDERQHRALTSAEGPTLVGGLSCKGGDGIEEENLRHPADDHARLVVDRLRESDERRGLRRLRARLAVVLRGCGAFARFTALGGFWIWVRVTPRVLRDQGQRR